MSYVDYTYENQMLVEENKRLREQVAHLSLFSPARRTEQKQAPVKAVGPTNLAFYGIVETDEEFAERAGMPLNSI